MLVGAATVISHHSDRRRIGDLIIALGGVILAVGLAAPYLVVTDMVVSEMIAWPLFGVVLGAVAVAAAGVAFLAVGYAEATATTSS